VLYLNKTDTVMINQNAGCKLKYIYYVSRPYTYGSMILRHIVYSTMRRYYYKLLLPMCAIVVVKHISDVADHK
jgi:hypothetical protein